MIISLRLEATLVKRSQNSRSTGARVCFNVDEDRNPTGGSIYDGDSYTAIWPVATSTSTATAIPSPMREERSGFSSLLLRSGNAYSFNGDGYDPYFSANLSITKEIGDHV